VCAHHIQPRLNGTFCLFVFLSFCLFVTFFFTQPLTPHTPHSSLLTPSLHNVLTHQNTSLSQTNITRYPQPLTLTKSTCMLLRLSVRPRPLHFSLLRTPMSQASSNIQNVIQCEERMPMSKASSNARLETPLFDGVDYDQVLLPNGILAMLVSDTSLQR
jgi:hypothetical protein